MNKTQLKRLERVRSAQNKLRTIVTENRHHWKDDAPGPCGPPAALVYLLATIAEDAVAGNKVKIPETTEEWNLPETGSVHLMRKLEAATRRLVQLIQACPISDTYLLASLIYTKPPTETGVPLSGKPHCWVCHTELSTGGICDSCHEELERTRS